MLLGAVGVASSGVVSYITCHSSSKEYTDFKELSKAEEKAGYKVKAVENFENGYSFKEMSITYSTDYDENDNELSKYKGISFEYEKEGEKILHIDTEQAVHAHEQEERIPDAVAEINGIEIKYYEDTYKWVPVGYELTDEDKENIDRSDYFISEGADEMSENQVAHVVWYQDNIRYSISNLYEITSKEILFEMAEELINK